MIKPVVEIAALGILYTLEWFFPLFKDRQDRGAHALRNISMGALNTLMLSLLFSSATVRVMEWAAANSFGFLNWIAWASSLKGVLAFILFDLWMYVWHVANHKVPFLWRLHRMHHSDPQMDSTTALRFHAGEIAFSALARLAVIPMIGMNFAQLLIYETCLQPVILFHHSNVHLPEKWDRVFRTVLVTPNMHRVHHSRLRPETDSDYSSIFSFWDRLARSFRLRQDTLSLHYGLEGFDGKQTQSFAGMIKTPFTNPSNMVS